MAAHRTSLYSTVAALYGYSSEQSETIHHRLDGEGRHDLSQARGVDGVPR